MYVKEAGEVASSSRKIESIQAIKKRFFPLSKDIENWRNIPRGNDFGKREG